MSERSDPAVDSRALQILKACCVAGMVIAHGFYWAATSRGPLEVEPGNPLFHFVERFMIVGIPPLLLPFTAGCALRLRWLTGEGGAGPVPLLEAAREAVVLALFGYAMNALAAGWDFLFAWNVLQFVGLSLVVIAVVLRVAGVPGLVVAALAVLAASDPLRDVVPFWQGPAWMRILMGDPMDFHTWPFLPWFPTVACGWLVAHGILRFGISFDLCLGLVLTGLIGLLLGGGTGHLFPAFDPRNLIGPRMMQPPALAAVAVMGWALLLTGIAAFVAPYWTPRRYGFVRCFSGGILWIYVVHVIVGARSSTLIGSHVDRARVLADPTSLGSLTLLLGVPLLLLLLCWGVGFLAVRWLHDTRIRIRVRRV